MTAVLDLGPLLELPSLVAGLCASNEALRQEIAELRATMPPTLVDLPEAARRLSCSISTVRRMVKTGGLPITRCGKLIRVDLGRLRGRTVAEGARDARAQAGLSVVAGGRP